MAIIAHMSLRSENCTVVALSGDTFKSKERIKEIGFRWVKSNGETPGAFSHWEKSCNEASSLISTLADLNTLGISLFVIGECFEDFNTELLSLLRKKEGH